MKFRLFHYWRSSSSWRVRWGLAIKKLAYEQVAVSLLDGESEGEAHRERNPLGYVPVVEILEEGARFKYLGESLAILEWLEEWAPGPSFLAADPLERARIRQLAEIINAGTQPIQNLTVQLVHAPDNPAEQKRWNAHWTRNGLQAYETLVRETAGRFSFGDRVTLADLCLIPQCYNAQRQDVELAAFPMVKKIYENALVTPECFESHPDRFKPPGA